MEENQRKEKSENCERLQEIRKKLLRDKQNSVERRWIGKKEKMGKKNQKNDKTETKTEQT